jgi:hypothetical protein
MCVVHVLLNALDMQANGDNPKIILEGASTALIPQLSAPEAPLHELWEKVKNRRLVDGVCRACAGKTGTIAAAKDQNLALLADMNGHPSMNAYLKHGFTVITF